MYSIHIASLVILLFVWNYSCVLAVGVPHHAAVNDGGDPADPMDKSINNPPLAPLVIPVLNDPAELLPIGSDDRSMRNVSRQGRFFGITTGASGNNLQLGLSFIVPFVSIPFGGGLASTTSSYYGTNYGTTPSYGTTGTTSLLGINTGSIIIAVIIGLAAIILIPLFIYSFTGVNTSPFGRSDDIQDILTNLASRVDDALQQYNIDAPSCVQRAICTQVKSSSKRMNDGTAGSVEKIIEGLATNSYLNSLLDGTKIQHAINAARKSGTPCSAFVNKCPYNMDTIYRALVLYAHQYGQQQQHGASGEAAADHFNAANDMPQF